MTLEGRVYDPISVAERQLCKLFLLGAWGDIWRYFIVKTVWQFPLEQHYYVIRYSSTPALPSAKA